METMKKLVGLLFLATAAAPCQNAPTLKGAFEGMFRIGVAINQAQIDERDSRGNPIIAQHSIRSARRTC